MMRYPEPEGPAPGDARAASGWRRTAARPAPPPSLVREAMMADCTPSSPSPRSPEPAALLDRLAAVDVRAPGAAVTERRFQCRWDRLTVLRFLRERWAAFALAAPMDRNAARVSVPSESEKETEREITLWLWPAPVARVLGRKETLRAALGPVGWAAAGATADDAAAPPGVLRLALCGRIEAEVEAGAAWGEGSGAGEGGQEKKTGTWSWEVEVAQLDLSAHPDGGCDGVARALAVTWPWLEALAGQIGPAWQWGTTSVPAPAATKNRDPDPGDTLPGLRRLQEAYLALCRAYRDAGEERRPTVADLAANQFMSESTLRRRLKALGADWERDFKALTLPADDAPNLEADARSP
jgi:hypothetical protein